MDLNAKKSQGMIIRDGSVDFSPLIILNGTIVSHFIARSKTQASSDHAEHIHSPVFAGLRSFWHFSSSTPIKTREMLAKSLLMPYLEYSSVRFSFMDWTITLNLFWFLVSAFNAVVRYVYGLNRRDYLELAIFECQQN